MKPNPVIALIAAALACASVQQIKAQTAGFIVGNPQATVRGGASADVDIVEGGGSGTASGTVSVKLDSLDNCRKHYVKFDLTGHNPNTNGPLYIRYDTGANSQRQDVQVWSLDQDFAGMASTLTWNTAQANDTTNGSALLTSGSFTATPYQRFLSASGGNATDATHQLHGPWGHMIRSGKTIYLVLSSVNNIGNNGLRFLANSVELGFDDISSGTPPSLGAIPNIVVAQGQASATNYFTVGDPEDGPDALLPVASSSNEQAVPSANVLFEGSGANRSVYVIGGPTPGTTTVTVSVMDSAGNQATRAFTVTNMQFNATPIIVAGGVTNALPSTNTLLNTAVTVPFAVSDVESSKSALTISAAVAPYSSGILASATIVGDGPNTNLSVVVTPQPGADGVGTVQLTCSDPDGNTIATNFCVMVRPSARVVFVDHFEYNGSNTKLTDDASNLWTRRNAGSISVFLRSGTDPATSAKVAWLRPSLGAEDLGAPLVGGPYSPNSRAILYTKFTATFADQASGGAGINIITNNDDGAAFFRLSAGPTSTTDFVNLLAVLTNRVADPENFFRVAIGNGIGSGTNTQWSTDFPKPVNLSTETGPITFVTRYEVATATATLWVNGNSESDPHVVGIDPQAPVSVGHVGLFQARGYGDIYIDDLTVTLVIRPLITSVSPPASGNVELYFAGGPDDVTADFEVERATSLTGTFGGVSAQITALGNNTFKAVVPASGDQSFYRVKRKPMAF